MPFSQFFVLSPRGDKIISKDYRYDIVRGSEELFFRKVKYWETFSAAPPVFNIEGITYIYLKKSSLYFVFSTRKNVSPNRALELLTRLCRLFKDYTGVLSEDSLRKNLVLIYEILDEVIDYGHIQSTSTEGLKYFIFNDPIEVEDIGSGGLSSLLPLQLDKKTVASNATKRSVVGSKKKNEIFIDVQENINVLFDSKGQILNSEIIGAIVMKSFLTGAPELRMGLNEDLVIGKDKRPQYGNPLVLDAINFSDFVRLHEFDTQKVLSLNPPDGEFTVMSYRIVGEFQMPFRIFPVVEEIDKYKIEVGIRIRCDLAKTSSASNVLITVPVPKKTASLVADFASGSSNTHEFRSQESKFVWGIKKFTGQSEQFVKLKIVLTDPLTYDPKKQVGPISLKFEIPMFNPSGLQVKFLRIEEKTKGVVPARWVRYIAQNGSYVCRV